MTNLTRRRPLHTTAKGFGDHFFGKVRFPKMLCPKQQQAFDLLLCVVYVLVHVVYVVVYIVLYIVVYIYIPYCCGVVWCGVVVYVFPQKIKICPDPWAPWAQPWARPQKTWGVDVGPMGLGTFCFSEEIHAPPQHTRPHHTTPHHSNKEHALPKTCIYVGITFWIA